MTLPSPRAGRYPARFFAAFCPRIRNLCRASKNLPAAKRSEIGAKRHRFDWSFPWLSSRSFNSVLFKVHGGNRRIYATENEAVDDRGVAAMTVASLGISTLHAASNASDNAANSPYIVYRAFSGLNGGTGFGPWTLNITGTGGDYINGATYDNTGVVTEPDFDIWNDTNDGAGGGTYGVDVTTAIRPFTQRAFARSDIQVFRRPALREPNERRRLRPWDGAWKIPPATRSSISTPPAAPPGYYLSDATNSDTRGDHGSLQLPDRRHILALC